MSIPIDNFPCIEDFINACAQGYLEEVIRIYENFIHIDLNEAIRIENFTYIDLISIKRATIEAYYGNHIDIIMWLYHTFSSSFNGYFCYTEYFIDDDSDNTFWLDYHELSYNFKILYLIWILQLACRNSNLEFIYWIILEISKYDYSYFKTDIENFKTDIENLKTDIENFMCWFYNKIHLYDGSNLKLIFEINKFETIKDLIKKINSMEPKDEQHSYKVILLEKILDIALCDAQENSKEILFLYGLIKNRMSDNIKSNILHFYIMNPNFKKSSVINMFKKVIDNTSNNCKINTILRIYRYKQKTNCIYSLDQLVKLIDCNIYVIAEDKLDLFIRYAINNDDIIALEYLSKLFYKEIISKLIYREITSKQYYHNYFYNNYFYIACDAGKLKIIEWFLKKFKKNIDLQQKQFGFTYLCTHGQLKIAHILYQYINKNDVPIIIISILEKGDLNALKIKWIKRLLNDYPDHIQSLFLYALNHNNVEAAFLIKKCAKRALDYENILTSLCSDFNNSVEFDRFKNYEEFEKNKLKIINLVIKSCIDNDFDFSCLYKCWKVPLKILKKIFKFNDSDIRLYKAILNSSLHKVKEAIKEGANIYALDNFLFFTSCRIYNEKLSKKALKIVNFFCLIESRYYAYEINEFESYYAEINKFKLIEFGKNEIAKNSRNF